MDITNQMHDFLSKVTANEELTRSHITLYTVLCQIWLANGCKSPFNISRRKIMKLARIPSKATYHKNIRELEEGGYINYNPTYHPVNGTAVSLLNNDKPINEAGDSDILI